MGCKKSLKRSHLTPHGRHSAAGKCVHGPAPPKRCGRAYWPGQSPAFCGAAVAPRSRSTATAPVGRNQAHVMAERPELTPDVVGSGTGLQGNETGRDVGQPLRELGAGELDPQHDGTAFILADKMKRVLAQVDAQGGDRSGRRGP